MNKKQIINLMKDLISEAVSFKEFEKGFYECYSELSANDQVIDPFREKLWELEERLSFAGENPPASDIADGYINKEQFIVWIKDKFQNELKETEA